MLARIAHELFWLGRNVSRAEHTARMIDGVFQVDIQGRQEGPAGVTLSWEAVLAIMGSTAEEGALRPSRPETVALLSTDPGNENSVVASLSRAREELTISDPGSSATRVRPPGTIRISSP